MWKSAGLLVVAGSAAYTYVIEPAWVNLGTSGAKCWWDGGVYIRATVKEQGYVSEMSKLIQNRARLETGEAKGCLPEPKCALSPAEAIAMIDRKIVSWGIVQEYQQRKLNFLGNMHDGKGLDLPGDGIAGRVDAMAKLDEAHYCTRYLQSTRKTLENAVKQ